MTVVTTAWPPAASGRHTRRIAIVAITAMLSISLSPAARASLIIDPTFDPTIADVSGAETAIDAAISTIEADISSPNNITVTIYFTDMSSGLGATFAPEYEPSYYQYYNAFQAVATQPNQLTALASLGMAPTSSSSGNPVNGNANMLITSAEARNLGFIAPGVIAPNSNIDDAGCCSGTYDGEIGLNTSITSPPGSLSGNYSLQAVANHEIDEVLGIGGTGSTLTGTGSLTGPIGDLDLYRYSAPGVRSYTNTNTTTPLAYFSINGGNTVLSYFSQTTGTDFADWLSNPIPSGFEPQVQDAYGVPGTDPSLETNELTAFNVIGYDLTPEGEGIPEPMSLAIMLPCVLGLIGLRRRACGTNTP